ncbi:MAG: ribbon-helix-helix domain-containing protein [Bacteroidetes bacterium]|nr:ribbon-helix-helix domain-containing protein [Bacteroidota bacterium]
MPVTKIAISMDTKLLHKLDGLVQRRIFPSRSKVIQLAVEEKITKMDKSRVARESAKLRKSEEQSLSEEGSAGDFSEWPEY